MSSPGFLSVTALEYFDVARAALSAIVDPSPSHPPTAPQTSGIPELEIEARILAACARERAETEARLRAEWEAREARHLAAVGEALRLFTEERRSYFARVETEVVHLALAIARKILGREAQLDPMLLAGLVRIALDGMQGSPAVRLRIAPARLADWQRAGLHAGVELVPDPACGPEECRLETEVGSAHLSFETQLKEVEAGFLDLLGQRPDRSPARTHAQA